MKTNFVLRSVAMWCMFVTILLTVGCGDNSSTQQAAKSTLSEVTGLSDQQITDQQAIQIAYENALLGEVTPFQKSSAKVADEKEKDKTNCNNGNDKAVGNSKKCDDDSPIIVVPPAPPVETAKLFSIAVTIPFIKGLDTRIKLMMNEGVAPFTFIPATHNGLSVDQNGYVTGKPANYGVYSTPLTVTDATGKVFGKWIISITTIDQPLSNTFLPDFKVGTSYSIQLIPDGMTGPYTYIATLPYGLKINATTGLITGSPKVAMATRATINLITKDKFGDYAFRTVTAAVTL